MMNQTSIPVRPRGREVVVGTATRYYVLFVLMLVGASNYLDRQVLTILLEPIRHEMSLNDTQIGFITGIAFTLLYVTLGIPAARLADRWSSRKVIAVSVSIWSVMTISCGLAQNFVQLFLARMGVGVGEAGGSPASQALVGDLFRREYRATAMSFLSISSSLGMALGLLWGGLALGKIGWRGAFMLAGLPGLILGPLVLFTIPHATRGQADGIHETLPQPPFLATVRLLWSIRSFRYMVLALAFQSFLILGLSTWTPSFLARSHGLSASTIGKGLAIVFGTANVAGTLIGGRLIDVLGRRDLRWHFWVPTVTIALTGAFATAFFCAPPRYVFLLLGAQQLFGYMFAGSALAITQSLAPVAVRATASACLWFVIFLVATGLGPQAIGFASDLLRPAFGEESLRVALLGATSLVLPAVFFFYRASLTYSSDLAAADARNRAVSA